MILSCFLSFFPKEGAYYDPLLYMTIIFFQDAIGDFGAYWLFAGVCVLNLIFCVTVVPETKGKTLEEISAYFGGPVVSSNSNSRHESDA